MEEALTVRELQEAQASDRESRAAGQTVAFPAPLVTYDRDCVLVR